jgi:hypothetical protein
MATTLASPKAPATPSRPKLSTHLHLVSPQQARELLRDTVYERQRPLRPYRVTELRLLLEQEGHFRPGTVVSFAVWKDHGTYCINGQHTLAALGATTGGPYWLQFEEHRVSSMEEVDWLYTTYDRNLQRSWIDLYKADSRLAALDLPGSCIEKLGGTVPILATGFEQVTRFANPAWAPLLKNPVIRFALMRDWSAEMTAFHTDCHGPSSIRKLLTRVSVLAVILVTYRYAPDFAHQFWPMVARDSGLTEGHPAHALLRYLRETGTRTVEPSTYQRTVASAWNAYVLNRHRSKLQPRAGRLPILIAYTPHDGKAHYRYLSDMGDIWHRPQVQAPAEEAPAP